ncbi:MAG: LacI family DNA-binding transcriptional regulator [Anaerolineae bacterium]
MKTTQKTVTLHDVARSSGVSYQTVSRVINNHTNVADETRERVLKAIQELNYRPNRAARSLVTNRSDIIAIISFGTSFYGPGQMLENIIQHARTNGFRVLPSSLRQLSHDDVKAAIGELHELLIDGIIMIAPIVMDFVVDVTELAGDIPFIQIDTKPKPDIASVVIDQGYGSKLATEHLIGLGHREIAEISGPMNWYDAIMRHQSWRETMVEHGLSAEMTVEGNWSAQSGYEGVQTLLKQGAKFTGLVSGNDQMALGAIAALASHGLRVPEDVSVVGFDDIPESGYFLPALTTIHQDFEALGEQSVDYLVSLIKNPDAPIAQRILCPKLVVRNSTLPLK